MIDKPKWKWMLLRDAHQAVADAYQNRGLAERLICRALAEGDLPFHTVLFEGQRRQSEPAPDVQDFFRRDYVRLHHDRGMRLPFRINWAESSAERPGPLGGQDQIYRINVSFEHVQKLLPQGMRIRERATAVDPVPPRHAGGTPRKYDRDAIVIAAIVYVREHGLPRSANVLIDKVQQVLGRGAPEDTVMKEIISPIYKGFKAALPAKR